MSDKDMNERLTQPVGVEPVCFAHKCEIEYVKAGGNTGAFYLANPENDPEFLPLYSAETFARLQAERDEARSTVSKKNTQLAKAWLERDALQEQVKMLREYFSASESLQYTLGHEDATAEDEHKAEERFTTAASAARRVVDHLRREEALAATEPKEKAE